MTARVALYMQKVLKHSIRFSGPALVHPSSSITQDEVEELGKRARWLPYYSPSMAQPLIRDNNTLLWMPATDLPFESHRKHPVLLGTKENIPYFVVEITNKEIATSLSSTASYHGPIGMGCLSMEEMVIAGRGRALLMFHKKNGYCSNCGHPTISSLIGDCRKCSTCQSMVWPRSDPVMITITESSDGGYCLLGRQPHHVKKRFTLLAGFVAAGESLEDAVRREVCEESGINVQDVHYIISQPWPRPSQLMLGCICRARDIPDRELKTNQRYGIDIAKGRELEDAKWFPKRSIAELLLNELPSEMLPVAVTLSHQLLRAWSKT